MILTRMGKSARKMFDLFCHMCPWKAWLILKSHKKALSLRQVVVVMYLWIEFRRKKKSLPWLIFVSMAEANLHLKNFKMWLQMSAQECFCQLWFCSNRICHVVIISIDTRRITKNSCYQTPTLKINLGVKNRSFKLRHLNLLQSLNLYPKWNLIHQHTRVQTQNQ